MFRLSRARARRTMAARTSSTLVSAARSDAVWNVAASAPPGGGACRAGPGHPAPATWPAQGLNLGGRQPGRARLDDRPLEFDRGGVSGQQLEQVTHPYRHPLGAMLSPASTTAPPSVGGGWVPLGRGVGVLGCAVGRPGGAGDQRAPQPPSSTRSDPVIESLPGEHRYTAAAAISAGSISRFTGEDARITLLSTSSSDKPCATA